MEQSNSAKLNTLILVLLVVILMTLISVVGYAIYMSDELTQQTPQTVAETATTTEPAANVESQPLSDEEIYARLEMLRSTSTPGSYDEQQQKMIALSGMFIGSSTATETEDGISDEQTLSTLQMLGGPGMGEIDD